LRLVQPLVPRLVQASKWERELAQAVEVRLLLAQMARQRKKNSHHR
jgi:hypothetical protein